MDQDLKKRNANEKRKTECEYGERCYRKNPAHFEEFDHQHLNKILKLLDHTKELALPKGIIPKISQQTLLEQLNFLRKIKCSSGKSLNVQENFSSSPTQEDQQESSSSIVNCSSQRKRQTVSEDQSKLNKENHKIKRNSSRKEECLETITTSKLESEGSNKALCDPNTSRTLSNEEFSKKMNSAQNLSEAMKYFQEVKKRSQGNILEKLKVASPYNFFLTSITDSRPTHTDQLSLQMFDILDPSLGDLDSSLQINFMVEFGWLMAQYHISKQSKKPLTLLYGEMDAKLDSNIKHVTAVNVKCPSPFGSHHTKMCVLAYKDNSLRVCVHTANLVESDWSNRVQGVWLSPLCPALDHNTDSDAGESATHFKRDLIQYLSAYRLPELQPWIGKLRRTDFSHINVFFVASAPGSHKGVDSNQWGHTKLGALLAKHAEIPSKSGVTPSTWQIIAQSSSIGSLGPQPSSWFCGEIKKSMSNVLSPKGLYAPPPLWLIYPSFSNVSNSHDGLLGGGGLPYCKKTHNKQPWLQQYLFQWKSDSRHRTKAMPHIKTYCRVSPDLSQLAWFHLTSANMSKAAWGYQTKAGATTILSYEAGVLFIPKFVIGQSTFPIKNELAGKVPLFPLPYDLPLTHYSSTDVPWFIDILS